MDMPFVSLCFGEILPDKVHHNYFSLTLLHAHLCHIMPYFIVFLEFCPPNSQRKYRDHTPTWHSTVISWKCSDPVYKPPPPRPFWPNASMHKGGGGVTAGFYCIGRCRVHGLQRRSMSLRELGILVGDL